MSRLLFFILILFSFPLRAQTLTLEKVLKAVQNHPAIASQNAQAKAALNQKRAESFLPDPIIGFRVEEMPLSNKSLNNGKMNVYSFSQEIPFPGTLIEKSGALKEAYKSELAMADQTARDIEFDAKKTYYSLVANQKKISALKTIISQYQQAIKSSEAQYATGMQSEMNDDNKSSKGMSDVLMVKIKKSRAEIDLHDLIHQSESLKARLNILMGNAPSTPINNLATPTLKKLNVSTTDLEKKMVDQNGELKSLKHKIKQSKKEVTVAKMGLIPTIEPSVEYNQRAGEENAYSVGVNLNIPLWGNRNAAEIGEAKAKNKKAQYDLETKNRDLKTELYYLIYHAQEHLQIVLQYKNNILPLAESNVKITQAAYVAGEEPANKVYDAIIEWNDASQMYWSMWEDYHIELAELERLIGENL